MSSLRELIQNIPVTHKQMFVSNHSFCSSKKKHLPTPGPTPCHIFMGFPVLPTIYKLKKSNKVIYTKYYNKNLMNYFKSK